MAIASLLVAVLYGWRRTHLRLLALESNVQQALGEIEQQLQINEALLPAAVKVQDEKGALQIAQQRITEATSVFEKSIAEREIREVLTASGSWANMPEAACQTLRASQERLDLVEDFYNQTVLKLNYSATHFPTSWVATFDQIGTRPTIPTASTALAAETSDGT